MCQVKAAGIKAGSDLIELSVTADDAVYNHFNLMVLPQPLDVL